MLPPPPPASHRFPRIKETCQAVPGNPGLSQKILHGPSCLPGRSETSRNVPGHLHLCGDVSGQNLVRVPVGSKTHPFFLMSGSLILHSVLDLTRMMFRFVSTYSPCLVPNVSCWFNVLYIRNKVNNILTKSLPNFLWWAPFIHSAHTITMLELWFEDVGGIPKVILEGPDVLFSFFNLESLNRLNNRWNHYHAPLSRHCFQNQREKNYELKNKGLD